MYKTSSNWEKGVSFTKNRSFYLRLNEGNENTSLPNFSTRLDLTTFPALTWQQKKSSLINYQGGSEALTNSLSWTSKSSLMNRMVKRNLFVVRDFNQNECCDWSKLMSSKDVANKAVIPKIWHWDGNNWCRRVISFSNRNFLWRR